MPAPKLDPQIVTLRERDQWRLADIAARYGVTKAAVSFALDRRRAGIPCRRARVPHPCAACGTPTIRRRFCSNACYHDSYRQRPATTWRQGQRRARRAVREVFALAPQHVVHHKDHDHTHNRLTNLWVFATSGAHLSFHRGGRGCPIWRGDGGSCDPATFRGRLGRAASDNTQRRAALTRKTTHRV